MDWRLWKHAKELGVKCAINPDAHNIPDLQFLAVGIGIARKGWLTKADVINCLPLKEVEKALQIQTIISTRVIEEQYPSPLLLPTRPPQAPTTAATRIAYV